MTERLRVPLPWLLTVLAVATLAAAQLHSGAPGFTRAVLPYLLLPGGVLVAAARLSRDVVRVAGHELQVTGARAPLSAFGPPEVLDKQELRLWLGPRALRYAYVAVKPWLGTAVRLPVVDPDDDTPYWLIGTRHPDRLVEALAEASTS